VLVLNFAVLLVPRLSETQFIKVLWSLVASAQIFLKLAEDAIFSFLLTLALYSAFDFHRNSVLVL